MSADSRGVTRVASLLELPAQPLLCIVLGHQWSDPPMTDVGGWGPNVDAGELRFTCACGRWKREVIDVATGEMLTRDYGGGTMLHERELRAAARAEWLRRKRAGKKSRSSKKLKAVT